ncbi:MAG: hypothetical protein IPF83_14910 [Rhodanobacteraceae bacterium]|nr:hypothetical protein [Rhodanobacteraceae bacterium]
MPFVLVDQLALRGVQQKTVDQKLWLDRTEGFAKLKVSLPRLALFNTSVNAVYTARRR